MSAPAAGRPFRIASEVSGSGIAGHHVSDERGASLGAAAGETSLDAGRHNPTPICSATVKMSLSPRPHRFITMRWSLRLLGRELDHLGEGVGGLERRDDALELGQELEGGERLLVGGRQVGDAADIVQPGMLRADAGIVEAGRDRMRLGDLPVVVLKQVGAVAVQDARPAAGERGRMQAGREAVAGRLDAVDLDVAVVEEGVEQADGVGAAADGGDQRIRQAALRRQHLLARLAADDALEVAHHGRIGMRPGHRADAVEGGLDVGDPVAQGLVHGVLEGARARLHRHDLGAQHLHAEHVRLLPLDVDGAHIDDAIEPEAGAQRRRGDAVLAGAGLGDDALLAHAPGEQDLAEDVVHLVRAGVVQLVALQVDLGAAEMLGQALGEIERARAADIVGRGRAFICRWKSGSTLAAL